MNRKRYALKSWIRRVLAAPSGARFCIVAASLLLASCVDVGFAETADLTETIDFNERIKPILSDRCFFCHGPDSENRQAELRLDRRDEVMRESTGEASHIIKPGDPTESEIYLRISTDDEDMRMPPAETKLTLTSQEIESVRQWIKQGAEWNEHWSFRPLPDHIAVPPLGTSDRPRISDWPRNDIDRFVLRRMMQHRLQPSPQADRETLIRRLTFDLTGLPPTLTEIDQFLRDVRADAYEHVVDRLLASQRYGERMTSEWMDVARYSDTYGYQVDRDRFVWPWRDWVIRAFNQNLPYDQFITQQLAGDLLPDASDDQILATTFNRLHPQKVEGGSVPEEFRVEYVADRNQTFATAFLGLTLECARCHDHKYDPITHEDYYQLSAFFDNIDEAGLYSYFTQAVPTPTLMLPDDPTRRKLTNIENQIRCSEKELSELATERETKFEGWLSGERSAQATRESKTEANAQATMIAGCVLALDFESVDGGANQAVAGKRGRAVKLTGDDGIGTSVGNFHRYDPFSISLWMNSPGKKQRAVIFHRSRAWTDAASRGYELLLEEDRLSAALIHFWPGNAIRVRAVEPLEPDTWTHVTVTYDGSSRADGLRIYVDGRCVEVEVVRDHLTKNITGGGGDTITIGQRFRDRGFAGGLVDDFQVFQRQLTPLEAAQLADGEALVDTLAIPVDQLTPQQRDGLRQYYLQTIDPAYQSARLQLHELRKRRSELVDPVPEIMVMRELPRPRPTHVLLRGTYDAPDEQVEAATPESLPPFPQDAPHNRLGLARWLCDPSHPLTGRVATNRYWQLIFGQGLVRTPEDFGSQGRPPTHPELLDWLARDFVDHDWDLKRLLKQMVMSATYRQTSIARRDDLEVDPENLWWSRAPSYRWPAEMLRDNALSVSGLLTPQVGGPPAKPYELEVAYAPLERDSGEGVYRRSVYTYWKRTGPAPVMMTLDASKRDVCRVRRERTSSPLQALVMLNGPQFVEAARALAGRVLAKHADQPSDPHSDQDSNQDSAALDDLFRWLTGRHANADQRRALLDLYQWQRDYFDTRPTERDAYLKVGQWRPDSSVDATQLAAMTAVANTLFSYDECIAKH